MRGDYEFHTEKKVPKSSGGDQSKRPPPDQAQWPSPQPESEAVRAKSSSTSASSPSLSSRQLPRTHFASPERSCQLMPGRILIDYDKTRLSDASAVQYRRSFCVLCARARQRLRHCQPHTFRAAVLQRGPAVDCTTYAERRKQNPASKGVPHVILCFCAERATGQKLPWTGCRTAS